MTAPTFTLERAGVVVATFSEYEMPVEQAIEDLLGHSPGPRMYSRGMLRLLGVEITNAIPASPRDDHGCDMVVREDEVPHMYVKNGYVTRYNGVEMLIAYDHCMVVKGNQDSETGQTLGLASEPPKFSAVGII